MKSGCKLSAEVTKWKSQWLLTFDEWEAQWVATRSVVRLRDQRRCPSKETTVHKTPPLVAIYKKNLHPTPKSTENWTQEADRVQAFKIHRIATQS